MILHKTNAKQKKQQDLLHLCFLFNCVMSPSSSRSSTRRFSEFGYRPNVKVENLKNPSIFWQPAVKFDKSKLFSFQNLENEFWKILWMCQNHNFSNIKNEKNHPQLKKNNELTPINYNMRNYNSCNVVKAIHHNELVGKNCVGILECIMLMKT